MTQRLIPHPDENGYFTWEENDRPITPSTHFPPIRSVRHIFQFDIHNFSFVRSINQSSVDPKMEITDSEMTGPYGEYVSSIEEYTTSEMTTKFDRYANIQPLNVPIEKFTLLIRTSLDEVTSFVNVDLPTEECPNELRIILYLASQRYNRLVEEVTNDKVTNGSLSFDCRDDLDLVFGSDGESEYKCFYIPNQNFSDDNGIFTPFQTIHDFTFLTMKTVGQKLDKV